MALLHQLKAGLRHWLNVVDEHSIHSPFFFDFYNRIVRGKTDALKFEKIERLRTDLLGNQTAIKVLDLGAGSTTLKDSNRTLADIASTSLSPRKLSEFYYRMIIEMDAQRVVELGACLGINTLYLAQKDDARIFTFEGSPALANVSLTNFEYLEQDNIQLIEGNLDATLPEFLQDPAKINFVLLDANHQYAPTMKYFGWLVRRLNEESIMVIDDIHLSEDMERAWEELQMNPLVYGSVDLFRCGILFFDPALNRQHFTWSLS